MTQADLNHKELSANGRVWEQKAVRHKAGMLQRVSKHQVGVGVENLGLFPSSLCHWVPVSREWNRCSPTLHCSLVLSFTNKPMVW